MRVFLLHTNVKGEETVSFEVLQYNRDTHLMRVRCMNGTEFEMYFNPGGRYNRIDYRVLPLEDDYAEFAKLCPRHPAGETHREETRRHRQRQLAEESAQAHGQERTREAE